MRAIVVEKYGGIEQLKLQERPIPALEPETLLVRLFAAGVNPVDTYQRSGIQGYTPRLPFTPGMDGAGVIEEAGEGIRDLDVGMKVYVAGSISGAYAEYCLCAPESLHPLPDELEWVEGACLGVPYFTAARALFTAGKLRGNETVLIHGASGGVGLACLQLCLGLDVTVYATAGSHEGEMLTLVNGAEGCFNHRDAGRFEEIKKAAGEGGVDLIVEMLANENLDADLKLLGREGRVVVVGSRGPITIAPRDLMSVEGRIIGVKMISSSLEERREYARIIVEGVRAGHIKPLIQAVYSFEDVHLAHQDIISGPHLGNLVIGIP